jgi:hypothetical protein
MGKRSGTLEAEGGQGSTPARDMWAFSACELEGYLVVCMGGLRSSLSLFDGRRQAGRPAGTLVYRCQSVALARRSYIPYALSGLARRVDTPMHALRCNRNLIMAAALLSMYLPTLRCALPLAVCSPLHPLVCCRLACRRPLATCRPRPALALARPRPPLPHVAAPRGEPLLRRKPT